MGSEYDLISREAQIYLQEFAQDMAMALTQTLVEPWAKQNGLYRVSRSIKTTYPIPVSAAGYKAFEGDVKYRSLFQKSLTLKPSTWEDGVAELASIVEAPDFTGWAEQPAAIAAAAQSLPNEIIAGLLEANGACELDGKTFFAADHPINVFDLGVGTFDNDITGAGTDPTVDNLAVAMANFDQLLAPNGKPAGYRMTHVFHPPAQRMTWKKILEQDLVIQTIDSSFGSVNNIYKGSVIPVCCYELTDPDQWYPAALNKPGAFPWIVQDGGAPEQIISDKTSHMYATQLKIGIAYILSGGGALALPHTMQRWAGTAP